MNWKNKIWKYATALVVVFFLLNPEMAELALFVDAVGLEIFLTILEIQVLAILGAFLNIIIKPMFTFVTHICTRYIPAFSWKNIKEEPKSLMLMVPNPATLMCALVFSVAMGIALNAH